MYSQKFYLCGSVGLYELKPIMHKMHKIFRPKGLLPPVSENGDFVAGAIVARNGNNIACFGNKVAIFGNSCGQALSVDVENVHVYSRQPVQQKIA